MVFRDEIIRSARERILLTRHALDQMNAPERLISEEEVKQVIMEGEIIEDYPNDVRGPSCVMSGKTSERRVIHVVCAPKSDYLAVITAYVPNPAEWDKDFKKRR